MGITPQDIAEVRMRASIFEVISEYVNLKKNGPDRYRGLCPFHGEKTPSFNVSPDKGFFKCFGCGEKGDVFAFMQKIKGLDFPGAVKELAAKYGVKLTETAYDKKEFDKRSQMLLLYEQAALYYQKLLLDPAEGSVPRKYLADRGITTDTIERFRLGYAPNSWDGLLTYLTREGNVSPEVLAEAGLIRKRQETSGHYDLFRNRLMVPICDSEGRVIAFGGRTLGDDQVKYLNSPESPIYHKSLHLFGFSNAKDSIKQKDAVIVVEGYFDVITCHQYGFGNAVATCGTALTEQQAKLLMRYTERKRVYLSFDADAAGVRAVDRGIEVLSAIAEGVGMELRVINIPGGKDPDECLRSSADGPELFESAIQAAPTMIEYQLKQAVHGLDVATSLGRIDASKKVVPILASVKNSVARSEYVRQWAMNLNIREEDLITEVGQHRRAHNLDGSRPANRFSNQNTGFGAHKPFGTGQGRGFSNFQRPQPPRMPADDPMPEQPPDDFGPPETGGTVVRPGGRPLASSLSPEEARALGIDAAIDQDGGQRGYQQGNFQGQGQGKNYQKGGQGQKGPNGGKGNFKGKNFKKEKEIADEEGLPMPNTREAQMNLQRRPDQGDIAANVSILGLYLTSREDYELIDPQIKQDKLSTVFHQAIKQAIDEIGPGFNTIEDLQYKIQDRISFDPDAAEAMIDVLMKADEFRKQKPVTQVVLNDSRARLLKDRLDRLTLHLRMLLNKPNSNVMVLQSKMLELKQIALRELPNAAIRQDLDNLRQKIEDIEVAFA